MRILIFKQQCAQHTKDITDYNNWTPRNHMSMKQGFEVLKIRFKF